MKLKELLSRRDEQDPFAPVTERARKGRVVEALAGVWNKTAPRGGADRPAMRVTPEARIRAALRVPEAVVKVASYGGGRSSAKGQLEYVSRDGTLEMETSDGETLRNKDDIADLVDDWAEEFKGRKGGQRHTIHMILSGPKGADREAILEAGRDFAKETFGENHPYALVKHDDRDHPHIHIIARMRGEDGRQFRIEAQGGFDVLRERFARAGRAHGVEMNATPRSIRGAARGEPIALRKMREAGRKPEIDKRAEELARKERQSGKEPPTAEEARKRRQKKLDRESEAHRSLARTLESAAKFAGPDRQEIERTAARLYHLADYLAAGGAETRPDKIRGRKRMTEKERSPELEKREQERRSLSPEAVAQKARDGAEKGRQIAENLLKRLPDGPEKEEARKLIKEFESHGRSLGTREGREPEKETPRHEADKPRQIADTARQQATMRETEEAQARKQTQPQPPKDREREREKERDRDRD